MTMIFYVIADKVDSRMVYCTLVYIDFNQTVRLVKLVQLLELCFLKGIPVIIDCFKSTRLYGVLHVGLLKFHPS